MSVFVNQGPWPRPGAARRASDGLSPGQPQPGRAEYLAQRLAQHIQAHATNSQCARVEFLK